MKSLYDSIYNDVSTAVHYSVRNFLWYAVRNCSFTCDSTPVWYAMSGLVHDSSHNAMSISVENFIDEKFN